MGTWGAGGFENDAAMDFIGEIASRDDLAAALSNCLPEDTMEEIDADRAQRTIAAAECVAAMLGRPAGDLPTDLGARLASFGKADPELVDAAKEAVSGVLGQSELMGLWAEDNPAPFNLAMTSLIDRLNPDLPFDPPDRAAATEVRQTCGFCDGEIEPEALVMIDVTQQTDAVNVLNRGFWCHLDCLNARLHPRHIIQNWKVDPEAIEREAKRLLGC